ncbi:MAG: shikimate dehydrogenase [Paracoccaceae bacterium]|uniref:shikimate dehydrogenase n=1 Tax=Roseibium sp. TaxID=1936156 RepID=UPI003296DA6F
MAKNFLSQLVGSFAMPAAENPTVTMMEAAFRHHDMDWRYLNCEVSRGDLCDAVWGAKAMGWAGFNCSVPHKVAVIEHLDGLGQSAEIMQAVNTIVRRGDKLIGENTDGKGFVQAMRTVIDPKSKTVVLFGAGGAARAVSVELALAGVRSIRVVNRTAERGQGLVDLLNEKTPTSAELHVWDKTFQVPLGTDITINATTIGLYPDVDGRLDLDISSLTPGMVVADGIHNPPRTPLIKDAEARGCVSLDGLGMLVNQGVIAIKHWSGVDVDAAVMRKAVEDVLS